MVLSAIVGILALSILGTVFADFFLKDRTKTVIRDSLLTFILVMVYGLFNFDVILLFPLSLILGAIIHTISPSFLKDE